MSSTLRYSPALDTINSWRINAASDGIDARIRVASGPDVTVSGIRLRYRAGKTPGAVFVRPLQEEIFQTESAVLDERLPRMELVLCAASTESATILRGL